MPYPTTLGALPAGAEYGNAWFTEAVALHAEPDSTTGYSDFMAAHDSFPGGGRKTVTLANPELAAVIASGMAASGYPGASVAQLVGMMTTVNGPLADGDQVQGIWPDLPAAIAARYVAAVQAAVPVFLAQVAAHAAAAPAIAQQVSTQQAWAAALARGTTRVPSLNDQGYLDVPTEAIVEGPTTLPDGEVYTIIHGAPGMTQAPDGLAVLWARGPSYQPAQVLNVSIRPGSCIPQVPGTGDWYTFAALTGDTGPCSGVPTGWHQGFGLVSARALASLQATSSPLDLPAAQPGNVPLPASLAAAYQQQYAPPTAVPVDENGNPINAATSAPAVVVTPGPVVLTQDEQGNIIAGAVADAAAVAPPVVVSDQLAASVPAAAGTIFGVSPVVALGLGGLAVWFLSGKGRR